jgi:hypothetical protein
MLSEPGRSSGLGFLPSHPDYSEQWFEEFYSLSPSFGGVGEAFTATGIAPDFNGIPF